MELGLSLAVSRHGAAAAEDPTLGPELVLDPSPNSGAQWTSNNGSITFPGDGTVTFTNSGLGHTATATLDAPGIETGETYRVVHTVTGYVQGSGVRPRAGGVSGTLRFADGTYSEDIVASSTASLLFTPIGSANIQKVTAVSCKKVL